MSIIKTSDDIKIHFALDDEKIIKLRQKHFENIHNKNYPKIGKIRLNKFNFDKLNVKHIYEKELLVLPDYLKSYVEDDKNLVVFKDGNVIYKNIEEEFKKIEIISYHDAVKNNDKKALDIFYRNFDKESDNKFITINNSLQNSAILIRIPKNTVLKETLKMYVLAQESDLVHHTFIIAEESSEIKILEKFANINTINANIVSEVFVSDNAKVNYIGIDRFCSETNAFIERRGYVNQNGSLIYALGQLNDGNTVSNNFVQLIGNNALAESRNVLLTDKDKIHAVTVNIEHLSPRTNGFITNHGVVKDKGYLHIDGIGKIHQGMHNANAKQSTNVITLSSDAKVSANPYLLIDEYDVMAGHGAAVGKVNEEQLYYLMSRGLTKNDAQKLIILGFLYPIIDLIDSQIIKENFIKTMERKLSI